jgi:hypothetical protein
MTPSWKAEVDIYIYDDYADDNDKIRCNPLLEHTIFTCVPYLTI